MELSASTQIGIKLKGSTELSAIYNKDHSPKFYESFTPPSLDPSYCLEIGAKATLEASATVALSMEVGLHQGLLSENTGIAVGLVMESSIGVKQSDFSSNFDLMVRFLIPFEADALY